LSIDNKASTKFTLTKLGICSSRSRYYVKDVFLRVSVSLRTTTQCCQCCFLSQDLVFFCFIWAFFENLGFLSLVKL